MSNIAQRGDGIQFDMAMLFFNAIFERTWVGRAGPHPSREYWGMRFSHQQRASWRLWLAKQIATLKTRMRASFTPRTTLG